MLRAAAWKRSLPKRRSTAGCSDGSNMYLPNESARDVSAGALSRRLSIPPVVT